MAVDGTILIDTKIDADGMQKGFEQIKSGAVSVSDQVKEISNDLSSAFGGIDITKPMVKAQMKIDELKQQILSVESSLDAAAASGQTETNNADVARMVGERERLYEQLSAAQQNLALDAEFAAQREAQAAEKAAQREAVAAEKAAQREVAATKKAEKEKERAEKKRMKESTKSIRHFGSRLKEITMGALVFNAISAGLRSVTQYMGNALKSNQAFATSLARVKGSLLTAFQPIYEAVLPALISLMNILNAIIQAIGKFFAALSGKSYSQMQQNAKALNKQAGALGGVGDAAEEAKKQLMGFDEINKLSDTSTSDGGGGSSAGEIMPTFEDGLSPKVEAVVNKVLSLIEPLKNIDFTPATEAFGRLGNSISNFGDVISEHLGWAWENILVPLSKWAIEDLAPATVDTLTEAFNLLSAALDPLCDGLEALYEDLQPVFAFIGDTVIFVLDKFREQFEKLAAVFEEKGPKITAIFDDIGDVIGFVWGKILKPYLEDMRKTWGIVFDFIGTVVSDTIGKVIDFLYDLSEFISGVFSGDWRKAWNAIADFMREPVNKIISILNAMISSVVDRINALFRLLSFNIDLPWGGSIGMSLPQFNAPQIPYLAQGAVIPPNKEFLAVLGDQTHGTNIEAPLGTIEDAVARVTSSKEQIALLREQNSLLMQILDKADIKLDGRSIAESVTGYQRTWSRARGI